MGAAGTANSNESNSYNPRLREAYLSYDDTATGWHLPAGQSWSLVTQFKAGIIPRQPSHENDTAVAFSGGGARLSACVAQHDHAVARPRSAGGRQNYSWPDWC